MGRPLWRDLEITLYYLIVIIRNQVYNLLVSYRGSGSTKNLVVTIGRYKTVALLVGRR